MSDRIAVGDVTRMEYRVPEDKTVPYLYPDSPEYQKLPSVFATGYMVGLLEWCAIKALENGLQPGESSVGTRVDIRHSAATPPGALLRVTATCTLSEHPYYEWRVAAVDEEDVVAASGIHGRNIIDDQRFRASAAKKAARLGGTQ